MRRLLIGLILLFVFGLTTASAAHLDVDGGALQYYEFSVRFPTRTPTVGPSDPGCTYTLGYWKNHTGEWPVDQLYLGGVLYTKSELVSVLNTPPGGDATRTLAQQFIAALLNVENGADPKAVAGTLTDADIYLAQHPIGSNPADQSGNVHAAVLDAFNNGSIGPGHCGGPDEPPAEPTPTPTVPSVPPVSGACTYSQGYWKTHPEAWPVDELTIGDEVIQAEGLLDLLEIPARGDVTRNLVQQLIAALLNVENGADPRGIEDTLTDAGEFLTSHKPGSDPRGKTVRAEGNALAELLDRYNNGKIGPSHCEDDEEGRKPASQMIEGGGNEIGIPVVTGVVIENATPTPALESTEELTVTETATAEPEPIESPTIELSPTAAAPEPTASTEPTATPLPEPTATPEPIATEPETTETQATGVTEGTEG